MTPTHEESGPEGKQADQPLDDSAVRMSLILANVSDIVFLLGVAPEETYRFEFVNPSFLAATGLRQEQVVGRSVQEVVPEPVHALVLGKYAEAIRERRAVEWEETSAYPSGERVGAVRVVPIFDAQDHCEHLLGIIHDITERRRAEAELRSAYVRELLISRIGQALLATTDPTVIQGRAVTLLGEALGADRCYLSSWDAAGDHILVPQDYHRADLPSVAGEYSAPQYAPVMEALFAHGTAVVPDVRSSELPNNVVAMMTGFALNCVLAVPFFARGGRIVAALMVAMTDAPRSWTAEEVSLAETVAGLTRTAVEAARVSQREHKIAEQLQRALQPPLPESVPGLKVTRYYEAALTEEAGVGGDFFDVFAIENGCTALVVGDLSGKGLQAAANVSVVRNMLRAFLYSRHELAEAVAELNRTLAEYSLVEGFATLFVGAFDGGTRVLRYVNCGQEPALLRRKVMGEVEELAATGPILGPFQGAAFEERVVALGPGDALAIFSDGLTECGPNRAAMLGVEGVSALFGQSIPDEGAQDAAEMAERLALHLIAGVDAAGGGVMRDDVCLLVAVVE